VSSVVHVVDDSATGAVDSMKTINKYVKQRL